MGRIILPQVKKQLIVDWLNGLSRDNYTQNDQISGGTVSAIVKELRKNEMPGIDLRGVAVARGEKNLKLYQFARSMRLKNMLDYLELLE